MTNDPEIQHPAPPDEILTLKDVAAYLKLAERTVYLYAQTGKIPGIKIGSAWRFRRSEIDQWLDEQRRITESSTKPPRALPLKVESSTLNVESSGGPATVAGSRVAGGHIQRSTSNLERPTGEPKEDAP